MGRGAGEFWIGTDFRFPDLFDVRATAESLLAEGEATWKLAAADFVFAVHQGYQFLFFTTGTTNDPEVLHWEDGDDAARSVAPSFSAWLAGCIQDEIEAARGLER